MLYDMILYDITFVKPEGVGKAAEPSGRVASTLSTILYDIIYYNITITM